MKHTLLFLLTASTLLGCPSKPPCESGDLPAAFKAAPLQKAVLTGEDVTVCRGGTDDKVELWRPTKVFRSNMDAVRAAQDNGWDRLSDNWYSSKDTGESPKWSELKNKETKTKLRIDVKKAGGGAMIVLTHKK